MQYIVCKPGNKLIKQLSGIIYQQMIIEEGAVIIDKNKGYQENKEKTEAYLFIRLPVQVRGCFEHG
jgi:hypothetical protein